MLTASMGPGNVSWNYMTGREPVMSMSTSLLALCCQRERRPAMDGAALSKQAQERLGWIRVQPEMIADVDRAHYFDDEEAVAPVRG